MNNTDCVEVPSSNLRKAFKKSSQRDIKKWSRRCGAGASSGAMGAETTMASPASTAASPCVDVDMDVNADADARASTSAAAAHSGVEIRPAGASISVVVSPSSSIRVNRTTRTVECNVTKTRTTTLPPPHHGKQLIVGACSDMGASRTEDASVGGSTEMEAEHVMLGVATDAAAFQLNLLPDELICNVTSFLDARSLLNLGQTSSSMQALTSTSASGWRNLCQSLWSRKVHVAIQAKEQLEDDPKAAFKASCIDASERQHVRTEELVYDPETKQGTIWSFRFKESAGADWTAWDPWYSGLPCRKMVFLADGSVKTVAVLSPTSTSTPTSTPTSALTAASDHENAVPSVHVSSNDNNSDSNRTIANSNANADGNGDFAQNEIDDDIDLRLDVPRFLPAQSAQTTIALTDPPMPMTWRLLTQPLDMPAREPGSYIRFSVGGREVPTYVVKRSPTNNWGFVMESCWGVYASFELPRRQASQRRRPRQRIRRTQDMAGNWFNVQVEVEDDSDDDDASVDSFDAADGDSDATGRRNNCARYARMECQDGASTRGTQSQQQQQQQQQQQHMDVLTDDSWFSVTSRVQRREAFLYNVGARVLPEGDDAIEFLRHMLRNDT